MKYYKTSNISIQNDNINSTIFINHLLLDYLDSSKFYFYDDSFDNVRKNIINNKYEKNKITNTFFNTNYLTILRLKDNKILKLTTLNNNNSLFNYEYFIHLIKKSKQPFIFTDNLSNTKNFTTINSIIYLYFNIR